MSMLQQLHDELNKFTANTNTRPRTAILNFDEGFKLLEEVKGMTKDKKAHEAIMKVLLSRDEEGLIEVFKGSEFFGMNIVIKRVMSC